MQPAGRAATLAADNEEVPTMDGVVLVAYASKHGSTREVAERVCETIQATGLRAHLRPALGVDDLDGYGGVVLGGALYMGRLHRHAHRFLRRHAAELADRPLAVFGSGPTDEEPDHWRQSREQLDAALARYHLDPVAVEVFGGRLDPSQLRFPLSRMPAGDVRDWDAITAWARSLPDLLGIQSPLLV
jgi:menaquinone-dependent protoporphyrinogen oxidase